MKVTVRDGTTAGEMLASLDVQLEAERVTVAELIRAWVHQEVRAAPQPADAERQAEFAQRAFLRGHVLLLVDDRQLESLSDVVTLRPETTITFLKLVPLTGG